MIFWKSAKSSLTWRIILLVATVQFIALLALFSYQRHFYNRIIETIPFFIHDVSAVFFNAHPNIVTPMVVVSDQELELSDNNYDSHVSDMQKLWQHIIDNNPNYWFTYKDPTNQLSHGTIPNRFKNQAFTEPLASSYKDSCVEISQNFQVEDAPSIVLMQAVRCSDGWYSNAQFGGLEPGYKPPAEVSKLYDDSNTNDAYKTFLAFLVTLIVIIPGIIYLLQTPIRRTSALVANVRPTGYNELIPISSAPTELRGLIGSLNDALQRLDEGYVRERRFRNAMAHEIRTPLTILRARLDDDLPPQELKASLVTDIRNIQRLVDQLLELANVASMARKFEHLDLVKETRQACAECGAAALKADININFTFPKDRLVIVQANPTALRLAIVNIINNAIHHSLSDENEIGDRTIDVTVLKTGAITIRDYGKGIPDEIKDSLFEPFSQARNHRGHGLGLAIVAEVMRYSQGHVLVLDAEPQGACFELYFKLTT